MQANASQLWYAFRTIAELSPASARSSPLWGRFADIMQEVAVLIAAGLREWVDFGVIIGILMLNAIVGWYQEKQAADVVASLKGDIAMKAVSLDALWSQQQIS